MKTAIIVPRRGGDPRRDFLWAATFEWLKSHHPEWKIYNDPGPDGPFNRGAALNAAARRAILDGADVLVVHDGDNVTDPQRLEQAVKMAKSSDMAVFPSDCYIYLDEASSDEYLDQLDTIKCTWRCTGHFFPRPAWFKELKDPARVRAEPGYNTSVRNKHISGIFAVPANVWIDAGGFVELTGWGREDAIFWMLLEHVSSAPIYLEGTTLHFHHEHSPADTAPELKRANSEAYRAFRAAAAATDARRRVPRIAESYGHRMPMEVPS